MEGKEGNGVEWSGGKGRDERPPRFGAGYGPVGIFGTVK